MCADSVSQCYVAGLGPLSLCYECVQLLFLRICEDLIKPPVAIASSRIPDKSPDSLPVHFLPETVLQSQANGASGPPCSLSPRAPLELVMLQINTSGGGSNRATGFHSLPSPDWTTSWQRLGCEQGWEQPKAIHHTFALFLPAIVFLNIFFSVYYMPVIYF